MREFLNSNTLFVTAAMQLDVHEGLILIVEGPDDQLLLEEFTTPKLMLISGTGGRSQVLAAARLARDNGISRIRFLVDRDYDQFSGSDETEPENVFASVHHDCFLDLIHAQPALLRRVIKVHSAPAERRGNQRRIIPQPEIIEQEAFSLAAKMAATRIVDARRSLCLDFKRLKIGSLKPSQFDTEVIADIILTRSSYKQPDRKAIISEAVAAHAEVINMEHSPAGDHDLFASIAHILKQYDIHVSDDTLQRAFIIKVDFLTLSRTGWYQSIQSWCESHGVRGFNDAPYSIAA